MKKSSCTTKLKVVFDASCKTDTSVSLNDILFKGPSIQEKLVCIMARFRTHKSGSHSSQDSGEFFIGEDMGVHCTHQKSVSGQDS
ncbi:Uncharacterized protein FWK35_00023463 [Aphis craccivora]|uniref:Uncharacterized protein n=1 Tax=Aphis craccivora TaxID=307492 RepID=A0A6G0YI68_APHCR|nr:Uncharacterized protein FWK35_00023463 [Aphis craccivora]